MTAAWKPGDVRVAGATRVGLGLMAALAILGVLELTLQTRAQLLTGQSVFTRLAGRSTYVTDPTTGLRLLRPHAVIRGQRSTMHTNGYGLRGADFPQQPAPGEVRVVLLGASTIMGTYAATDDATSSAQLEKRLAATVGAVRVINGGVAGLTVGNQATLLQRRLLAFEPSVLVWYPGLNDFTCRPRPARGSAALRWQMPPLPGWLILPDLITKNTSWLRAGGKPTSSLLEPAVDLPRLERELRAGIRVARAAGVRVELVTSARNFNAAMEPREAARRAASALNVRPCYSVTSLSGVASAYDELLRRVARDEAVGLIDADRSLAADPALFGDSTHLSAAGEKRLADLVLRSMLDHGDLDGRVLP
jgi:lysophospholipase L1-like esterase